jgi:16S rRNA (cytosine967-C5)-methyltransferase
VRTPSAANGISREEAAAEVLVTWEEEHSSLRKALHIFAEERGIKDWQIRTAIHSLVFETVRRLNTLDWVLNAALKQSTVNDLDPVTRNVLRIATYLILFGKAVPALVTNEAVSIVKRRRNSRVAGFCNAVLRKMQSLNLEDLLATVPEPSRSAFRLSVPPWLLQYGEHLLGAKEARDFFAKGLENPPVYVRVNTLRTSVDETVQDLVKEGFQCVSAPGIPEVLKLERGSKPVTHTAPYMKNAIYIQSLASALVSRVISPASDAIIVDLCAAPGSKTSHLAQLMHNRGIIVALDNALARALELQRNLLRLGVRNSHIVLASSFQPPFRDAFHADYVLVDPPCSNTGVIQTRPEVKWNITPERIERIQRIQTRLLNNASSLVAPSGYAVYSTCSITLEENEHLVRSFLSGHPDFELAPTEPYLGVTGFGDCGECQRLYPHRQSTEGFFIAKLHRKETAPHGAPKVSRAN